MEEGTGDDMARRLRSLVDGMRSGVTIYDPEGNYLYVNEAAAEVLDRDMDALVGTSVYECHSLGSREKVRTVMEAFRSGERRVTVEDSTGSSGGTIRETMVGLWDGEDYLGLACVYEDVSRYVEMEPRVVDDEG
jgi:PAS domain S-box-containing protein